MVQKLGIQSSLGFQHFHAVRAHAKWEVHEFQATRVVAKDHNRQRHFAERSLIVCVTSDQSLALINDGEFTNFCVVVLLGFDVAARSVFYGFIKLQSRPRCTHFNIPSNTPIPRAISSSSARSSARISPGARCCTCACTTSL